MKVVFFGTPFFAAHVLSYLLDHDVEIVAVVTKPDRAQGRSATPVTTPVKGVALAQIPPLPVYQPEIVSTPEFAPLLEVYKADLFVVVAYGEILKQHLLEMPTVACINLHASLLPAYRGAAPIQRCLINGESESGVTIMHMARKMDAGDIIDTKKVAIHPNMTYGQLEQELCHVGSELLLHSIQDLEKGTAKRTPQDHSAATFAQKIELEDCQVDWKQPAECVHNLVRGVNPHPGAWCWLTVRGQTKRLRILETRCELGCPSSVPGEIITKGKDFLAIACGQGAVQVLRLQLEGKKPMTASEFVRGFALESLRFEL